ncbi:MAG: hypothetical protein Q8S21_03965 [Candidatus Paracaedibacteraceae bacterium]|nr:hypothetical protein [Candidatus Paracaedibacteraceae bacterium]
MKSWTANDIDELKKGFLTGTPLKELAWKMKRTPTALNKALTRFGIRTERPKSEKSLWNDFGNSKTPITINPMCAIKRFDKRFRKIQKAQTTQWVEMDKVLSVMDAKGHHIYVAEANKDPRQTLYFVDGKKVTALQVVFLANRYRIEQGKHPFCVEDITC